MSATRSRRTTQQEYGELFDLLLDPGEVRNLWDDAEYAGLKAELLLKLVQAEMGAQPLYMPRIWALRRRDGTLIGADVADRGRSVSCESIRRSDTMNCDSRSALVEIERLSDSLDLDQHYTIQKGMA